MSEGIQNQKEVSPEAREKQLNDAKINSAITALGDRAFAAYVDIFKPAGVGTQEEFLEGIKRFNDLSGDIRGEGTYDANRTLDERVERSMIQKTPSGYELTVTLEKDGAIRLSTAILSS